MASNMFLVQAGLTVKDPTSTLQAFQFTGKQQSIDRTGSVAAEGVASIGFAAHEAIPLGDVTTIGWCLFINHDATNYVEIGTDVAAAFKPFLRLEAKEFAVMRLSPSISPYAQANVAAVALGYHMFQD